MVIVEVFGLVKRGDDDHAVTRFVREDKIAGKGLAVLPEFVHVGRQAALPVFDGKADVAPAERTGSFSLGRGGGELQFSVCKEAHARAGEVGGRGKVQHRNRQQGHIAVVCHGQGKAFVAAGKIVIVPFFDAPAGRFDVGAVIGADKRGGIAGLNGVPFLVE